jgi:hypothetical protein
MLWSWDDSKTGGRHGKENETKNRPSEIADAAATQSPA